MRTINWCLQSFPLLIVADPKGKADPIDGIVAAISDRKVGTWNCVARAWHSVSRETWKRKEKGWAKSGIWKRERRATPEMRAAIVGPGASGAESSTPPPPLPLGRRVPDVGPTSDVSFVLGSNSISRTIIGDVYESEIRGKKIWQ